MNGRFFIRLIIALVLVAAVALALPSLVVADNVVYAGHLQYDPTKPSKAGSTIPIKLQLRAANGVNLSSPDIVVTAYGVSQVSSTTSAEVPEASGIANPDNNSATIPLSGVRAVVYSLSTRGFDIGTYAPTIVSGNPVAHTLGFQVK